MRQLFDLLRLESCFDVSPLDGPSGHLIDSERPDSVMKQSACRPSLCFLMQYSGASSDDIQFHSVHILPEASYTWPEPLARILAYKGIRVQQMIF